MDKALLVMHSPVDEIVSIQEAERIYKAAAQPKSFISLDSANHLLTRKQDAQYVATLVAAWSSRFLPDDEESVVAVKKGEVKVRERDHRFLLDVRSDSHHWNADEPESIGAATRGPTLMSTCSPLSELVPP